MNDGGICIGQWQRRPELVRRIAPGKWRSFVGVKLRSGRQQAGIAAACIGLAAWSRGCSCSARFREARRDQHERDVPPGRVSAVDQPGLLMVSDQCSVAARQTVRQQPQKKQPAINSLFINVNRLLEGGRCELAYASRCSSADNSTDLNDGRKRKMAGRRRAPWIRVTESSAGEAPGGEPRCSAPPDTARGDSATAPACARIRWSRSCRAACGDNPRAARLDPSSRASQHATPSESNAAPATRPTVRRGCMRRTRATGADDGGRSISMTPSGASASAVTMRRFLVVIELLPTIAEVRATPASNTLEGYFAGFDSPWGRSGFDGGAGSRNACRGPCTSLIPWKNNVTANADYALAA